MRRGRLRIYLGAAPGVGKTFAMLDEGFRRRERGTDVVVGYVETHNRPKTKAQIRDLEVVPRRALEYRGAVLEEMDIDGLLARSPEVALVDELAHTNVPGSRNEKRWQDVEELLEAGVDVISTVNIQHLESMNDVVQRITGVQQRETVPDAFVRSADQVELVDMDPEALRRRMAHGNIYAPEKVDAALANYFRAGNLGALRELALLWVADKVDDALQDYMDAHEIDHSWEARERVVVAVTGAPSSEHLIRRASRMAQRAKGDLLGVHVTTSDGLAEQSTELLDKHRRLLDDLGGTYHEIVGTEAADALLQFAKTEHATQLVLGASSRSRWSEATRGSVINRTIRAAGEIDVHVISTNADGSDPSPQAPLGRRRTPQFSVRRTVLAWALATVGVALLTLVLIPLDGELNLTSEALLYLLFVAVVAVAGGRWPSIAAAVIASLALNWFFTPPVHTFTITDRDNALAFAVFLLVAALVGQLVSVTARRAVDVSRARAEAEALARVAAGLVGTDDPLPEMVRHLRATLDFESVAVLVQSEQGWYAEELAGNPVPSLPSDADETVSLGEDVLLALYGHPLSGDDRRVVYAFAAQVRAAREQRVLRRQASAALAMTEADRLRTAILRAVSHDLRTPLASIKASVTSLLSSDVAWSDDAEHEFLATIDEETDRLDDLVGNLLDMSRIESGALDILCRPVGVEEVVAGAMASMSDPIDRVDVEVSETLPRVLADAALLERAVANLTANALHHAPGSSRVRIEAGVVADRVDLRVVDRGPGIPRQARDSVFEPFQRLGDSGNGTGVGLGLAVAKGFVEAMDGRLVLEDTPGGGLTAVIELPRVVA